MFMKKGFLKYLVALCLALLVVVGVRTDAFAAETPISDIQMVVSSSAYQYSAQSAVTSKRAGYRTFGEEVYVTNLTSEWATISDGGKTYYMKSKNLDYMTKTVIKNRVMVSPGAYACSVSSTKGYVFYGTEIDVLGETTTKKGVTYVHCVIDTVYENDGTTVRATNVEGYINAEYLAETAVPKIVNTGTNLYASAYGSSSAASLKTPVGTITTGEEVSVLMSNKTWSKVRYNGEEYYMSTNRLDSKKMQILVNRAMQTYDAKPGSGYQHYVYWGNDITVLNTYESETYGTYYYCKIDGDYGFVREISSKGIQYVGYIQEMQVNAATNLYEKASNSATVLCSLSIDTTVTLEYVGSAWARVNIDGTVGYVPLSKLSYPEYTADGKYYSTSYRLYKKLSDGTLNETVQMLAQNSKYGYAMVEREDGTVCWMKQSSLTSQQSELTTYVALPLITLHTQANTTSSTVSVPYRDQVTVLDSTWSSETAGWIKVKYNDTIYYMWQEVGEEMLTTTQPTDTFTGTTDYQQQVLDEAVSWLSKTTKYAHNASDGVADSDGVYGFDCSGYVAYVLDTVMQQYVPTYNVSADLETMYETTDIYNKGYTGEFSATVVCTDTLDESQLQPGDVLFFNLDSETDAQTTGTGYNHCGIYLGNGEFIHCSHSWDGGVRIMPLNDMYETGFVAAKRYLPETVTSAEQTMYTVSQKNNVYAAQDSSGTPIATLEAEVAVTLEFTDNGNWAYVRLSDGSYGYMLVSYLTTEEPSESGETRYVIRIGQKLYNTYSSGGGSISVPLGTEVTYQGRYSTSSYYKVTYDGSVYYAYIPSGDIDSYFTTDYDAFLEGTGTATVSANTNLRVTTNGTIIRLLKSGETVTVITSEGSTNWTYVKSEDGEYGYVLSKYLEYSE